MPTSVDGCMVSQLSTWNCSPHFLSCTQRPESFSDSPGWMPNIVPTAVTESRRPATLSRTTENVASALS